MTNRVILSGKEEVLKAAITQAIASHLTAASGGGVALPANDSGKNAAPRRKKKPNVTLYFLEDLVDVAEDYDPIAGEISFRLMGMESNTITKDYAQILANRIKTKFGGSTPFVWRKGKEMYSYTDWDKGYQLQLLCRGEAEAMRIVESVLDLQGHSPEWEFLNINTNKNPTKRYPTIPEKETIFGEVRRLPRQRPICDVRFSYATLKLYGIPQAIVLVDETGKLSQLNPLVS